MTTRFRARSTTRAIRTSAEATSEAEARINTAGVIIAAIMAIAGDAPVIVAPSPTVDESRASVWFREHAWLGRRREGFAEDSTHRGSRQASAERLRRVEADSGSRSKPRS